MRFKVIAAMMMGMLFAITASAQTTAAAPPAPDPDNILLLDLSSGGQVQILLRPDKAPNSVDRIKVLARRGFYNGLIFHRVIEGFMAQGGDPKGDGTGGSDLPDLKAEFSDLPHVRGTMSMARAASEDSANSQFFIMLMPNLSLDGHYTAVGRVISGMQYVDAIEKGEPPANPTKIIKASIASGDTPSPTASAAPPPVVTPAPSVKEQAKADKEARRAMEEAIHHAEEDKASAPQ
jgi:cyclophilin family peptidyl-prolyl cis-trans isomerase